MVPLNVLPLNVPWSDQLTPGRQPGLPLPVRVWVLRSYAIEIEPPCGPVIWRLKPAAFQWFGPVPAVTVPPVGGGGEHPKTLPPRLSVNVNEVGSGTVTT